MSDTNVPEQVEGEEIPSVEAAVSNKIETLADTEEIPEHENENVPSTVTDNESVEVHEEDGSREEHHHTTEDELSFGDTESKKEDSQKQGSITSSDKKEESKEDESVKLLTPEPTQELQSLELAEITATTETGGIKEEVDTLDVQIASTTDSAAIQKMEKDLENLSQRDETETQVEFMIETKSSEAATKREDSRYSLHAEELPEIRGLAELEYASEEESLLKEGEADSTGLQKRRSIRASMAIKLYKDAEEEITGKKKKKGLDKDAMSKGTSTQTRVGSGEKISQVERKEKSAAVIFTREMYYAMYDALNKEYLFNRIKNRFLQRKLAEYFKRRKMEHALKEESDVPTEVVLKYERKLDRLANIIDVYNSENKRINDEIGSLQSEKFSKYERRANIIKQGINREREIGFGLISVKTGEEIPDYIVEQLIRRQINAALQISELRLKFIIRRNEFNEKTAELKALDNIGEDLSLVDYEQLKIENRSYSDKLEEKEEELTKLRIKCRNAVQIMAHVREKSAALDTDMDILKENYEEVHSEYIEMREHLNRLKTERDTVRNKTMKLKADSGLLTKTKLLIDMETALNAVNNYEKTLERVKNEYNLKTQQIRNLRKNITIEMLSEKQIVKEKKKVKERKFFKVRPTIVSPKVHHNVFERLEKVIYGRMEIPR